MLSMPQVFEQSVFLFLKKQGKIILRNTGTASSPCSLGAYSPSPLSTVSSPWFASRPSARMGRCARVYLQEFCTYQIDMENALGASRGHNGQPASRRNGGVHRHIQLAIS